MWRLKSCRSTSNDSEDGGACGAPSTRSNSESDMIVWKRLSWTRWYLRARLGNQQRKIPTPRGVRVGREQETQQVIFEDERVFHADALHRRIGAGAVGAELEGHRRVTRG